MAIKLDEKTVALWFVSLTAKSDWLAAVREIEPDVKYELTYRFRYYEDDKVFESGDKKNWYNGEVAGTRHYVLSSSRLVFASLKDMAPGRPAYEYVNDGNAEEFRRKLQDAPFMFMRQERAEL